MFLLPVRRSLDVLGQPFLVYYFFYTWDFGKPPFMLYQNMTKLSLPVTFFFSLVDVSAGYTPDELYQNPSPFHLYINHPSKSSQSASLLACQPSWFSTCHVAAGERYIRNEGVLKWYVLISCVRVLIFILK